MPEWMWRTTSREAPREGEGSVIDHPSAAGSEALQHGGPEAAHADSGLSARATVSDSPTMPAASQSALTAHEEVGRVGDVPARIVSFRAQ